MTAVYAGEFAEFYDLFYADKRYDLEAAFVDRQLREHAIGPSRRLLDVACGTGQHAVRFATAGWDVVGVDQSDEMLARARARAAATSAEFIRQDMRTLQLEERFDASVCLFDSIGYGVTNDGIVRTLIGIRQHLRTDGLFVVEFWHAAPMLRNYDPVRVRQWETPKGRVVRTSRTSLDVVAQVARVEYDIYRFGADGRYAVWNEVHENRYFLVQEMDLLLRTAGLVPLSWHAGYVPENEIDETTWHVVGLARASDRTVV